MPNPEPHDRAGQFVGQSAGAPALASLRCARPGQLTGMNREENKMKFNLGVD
jgi:hypothetical protein